MGNVLFDHIDWDEMWQQARQQKSWKSKGVADWDKKAASFAKRTAKSIYIDRFLDLLQPEKDWSVLDVGCGPGTLALPLADKVAGVTAIDFSPRMLAILSAKALKKKASNITVLNLSWEDDWEQHGIATHDVAIASRSLAVKDLRAALERLTAYATKMVVITDQVKHGPFDPDAFAAVGRPLQTGPDFIYTINLLYQMGHLPSVNYIRLEETLPYPNIDETLTAYNWMFRDLTAEEKKRLKKYIQSISTVEKDGTVTIHRPNVPTWAFISWQPHQGR